VALLAFLLAEQALFVIATFGAGSTAPEPLDALWRGGRAIRIDLGTFDRPGVELLLHFALQGPITASAAQALWDASQGNVLYLRELVTTARDEGVLGEDGGAWALRRDLGAGAGVSALVERRVRDLAPPGGRSSTCWPPAARWASTTWPRTLPPRRSPGWSRWS
jgi:hypothetical protein